MATLTMESWILKLHQSQYKPTFTCEKQDLVLMSSVTADPSSTLNSNSTASLNCSQINPDVVEGHVKPPIFTPRSSSTAETTGLSLSGQAEYTFSFSHAVTLLGIYPSHLSICCLFLASPCVLASLPGSRFLLPLWKSFPIYPTSFGLFWRYLSLFFEVVSLD